MLIVAGIGRKVMCRTRIWVTNLLPRLLISLHLGKGLFSSPAGALAPVNRLAAAQPIDDVPGQRSEHFARVAIGQDGDPDAKVRHEGHQCPPTWPTSTMKNQPVTTIALTPKAEAIVRYAKLGEFRLGVVDARRMQCVDQRSRQQAFAIELALAEMQPHPVGEVGDRGV